MDENLIKEKSEKSQSLERLSICLRIVAIVSLLIGAYLLLTNPNTGSNSTSIRSGMQTLNDNVPMIEFGMTVVVGLVLLILAFINRKESPKLALFYLVIGIGLPLLIWFLGSLIPQTGFASAFVKF